MSDEIPHLNATQFVPQLTRALETAANILEREPHRVATLAPTAPWRAAAVLAISLRTSRALLRGSQFIAGDDSERNPDVQNEMAISLGLQARTGLEILFNVAFLLVDLEHRSRWFDRSGWREIAIDFEQYREEYLQVGGRKRRWALAMQETIAMGKDLLKISDEQAADPERMKQWPTPGEMWRFGVNEKRPKSTWPNLQRFLRQLYFEHYKPLSGEVHGNGYGQLRSAVLVLGHALPHDMRKEAREERYPLIRQQKFIQLALFALCTVCEVQHAFSICDANLDARLGAIWAELTKVEGHRDLFELRYSQWYPFPILGGK